MKLKRFLFIFPVLQILFFTGCWSSHEVNTLGITVCIGIDKSENGYLVSKQIINPRAIASDKATMESPIVVYTTEVNNMAEVSRRFMTQSSRKINDSHLRLVIFSEAVAKEGIQNVLDFFARNNEFRTDYYFVVATNATAKEILGIFTPIETIPGVDMYNSLEMSEKEWAPIKTIRIIELVSSIMADGKNPVLTGIEISQNKISPESMEVLKQSGEYKLLKFSNLSVFSNDKLVGWLDEDESKGYNYITANVKSTVEYAYSDEVKITSMIMKVKSSTRVYLLENKPAIEVKIKIMQNIRSVEGSFDVTSEKNKQILNEMFAGKVKSLCEKSLNKVQKELRTDVFGFGEAIHRKYPKIWKKIKDDWNDKFSNLPVNITVEVETKQLGEITKPLFMKEEE